MQINDLNNLPPATDPRFAHKPGVILLKAVFSMLSRISPTAAAQLGLRLFLTPQRHKTPNWEFDLRSQARVGHLMVNDKDISTYSWGEGPTVLLSHSWGGRGTQLGAFVKPFIDAGYRVVAFDGPAHGHSSGKQTDMIEFAQVIKAVADNNIPVHAVIGHSFGAANTLLAIRDFGLAPNKVVLIGCFAHGIWVIDTFGKLLRIPNRIVIQMRHLLELRHGNRLDWNSLSLVEMARNAVVPILLVHDTDDKEVPYPHALAIQAGAPNVRLKTTAGNGHRRILRDAATIMDIVTFVQGNE